MKSTSISVRNNTETMKVVIFSDPLSQSKPRHVGYLAPHKVLIVRNQHFSSRVQIFSTQGDKLVNTILYPGLTYTVQSKRNPCVCQHYSKYDGIIRMLSKPEHSTSFELKDFSKD